MNNGQGAAPRDLAEVTAAGIAEHVAAMREMVEAEVEGRREMELLVETSRERERRLMKAINALEGQPLTNSGRPKAKPKAAATGKLVSEDTRKLVIDALREAPLNTKQIMERTGRAQSVVSAALRDLRRTEHVRLIGKDETSSAPVKPNLYALMPDAS